MNSIVYTMQFTDSRSDFQWIPSVRAHLFNSIPEDCAIDDLSLVIAVTMRGLNEQSHLETGIVRIPPFVG